MKRKSLIIWGVVVTALLAVGNGGGIAAPTSKPAGPWITPDQNVSLEAFESYEQLVKKLKGMEERSRGLMELESVAVSGEGRDVWLVKLGNPMNTPVLVITQQHGHEPHGTEAALEVISRLITDGGHPILDELYVLIIPRVNPDGSELFNRGNNDFNAPLRDSRDCFLSDGTVDPTETDKGRGVFSTTYVAPDGTWMPNYDINRYHWPDWSQSWQILCNPGLGGRHYDPALNPVPEALGVRKTYDDYDPIWVMDVHNQGSAKVQDDVDPATGNRPERMITSSVLWPTNEDVDEGARNLSKQMTIAIKQWSLGVGYAEVTNYLLLRDDGSVSRGGGFPGIARNAYGLLGTERLDSHEPGPLGGSILVEIRGQGQKSIGMLKNVARGAIWTVLKETADGSLFDINPALADTLLPPGNVTDDFIGNPRNEDETQPE